MNNFTGIRFKRYFAAVILLLIGIYDVSASQISISGIVKNISGDAAYTQVMVFQFGDILSGGSANEEFKIVGRTQTNKQTGEFSLIVDNTGINRLVVAARYGDPEYYIFQEISDITANQSGISLNLPNFDKGHISIVWEVRKNGVSLNPSNLTFAGTIIEVDSLLYKRTVNFTTREYLFNQNQKIYDLPNGNYKLKFALFEEVNGIIQTEIKIINFTLPISESGKLLLIEFP